MSTPNDMTRIIGILSGDAAAIPEFTDKPKKAARRLIRRTYTFEKASADGAAGTATAYTAGPGIVMPTDGRILGAKLLPRGAATASDADYATVNIDKSDAAGGAATHMASLTTKTSGSGGTGNLAAGVAKSLTVSATLANTRFTKGQLVSLSIAKTGNGVAVPASTIQIDVEEESPDAYPVG